MLITFVVFWCTSKDKNTLLKDLNAEIFVPFPFFLVRTYYCSCHGLVGPWKVYRNGSYKIWQLKSWLRPDVDPLREPAKNSFWSELNCPSVLLWPFQDISEGLFNDTLVPFPCQRFGFPLNSAALNRLNLLASCKARREKLQHLELWKKLNAGQLYQVWTDTC